MRLFQVVMLLALLGAAVAQTVSPSISPAASPSGTSNCSTLLLNGTQPFDIFLLGASASPSPSVSPAAASSPTLNLTNSLLGGTAAVNGNAVLTNSLIGSDLNCSTSASPSPSAASASVNTSLLVTGDLNSTNSRVSCSGLFLQVGSNVTRNINFSTIGAQLLNKSRALCLANSTVQTSPTNGSLQISLPSNASQLTIVNINASDLATLRLVSINASSSSTASNSSNIFVVINVIGSNATASSNTSATSNVSSSSNSSTASGLVLQNIGLNVNGLNSSQLLWNFCNATENVSIQFMRIMGSILAPQANVILSNAGLQGSLVARSLNAAFTTQSSAPFGGFFCNTNATSSSNSTSA